MTVWSAVDCVEEHGTASEGMDLESGSSASVTVRCLWADRLDLIVDVLSNRRAWPYGAGSNLPQAYSASCVPVASAFTAVGQGIIYSEALVTLNYSSKIKDLVSETIEPTAEFVTLDYKRFRWGSGTGDALVEAEAPGLLQRGLNVQRTLYEQTSIPAAVLTAVGHCNLNAYVSSLLGLTFATETLLYNPPNLQRTVKSDGNLGFTVALKMSYKPNGWNKYWRAKTQAWSSIYLADGAIYKSYPTDAMVGLLT